MVIRFNKGESDKYTFESVIGETKKQQGEFTKEDVSNLFLQICSAYKKDPDTRKLMTVESCLLSTIDEVKEIGEEKEESRSNLKSVAQKVHNIFVSSLEARPAKFWKILGKEYHENPTAHNRTIICDVLVQTLVREGILLYDCLKPFFLELKKEPDLELLVTMADLILQARPNELFHYLAFFKVDPTKKEWRKFLIKYANTCKKNASPKLYRLIPLFSFLAEKNLDFYKKLVEISAKENHIETFKALLTLCNPKAKIYPQIKEIVLELAEEITYEDVSSWEGLSEELIQLEDKLYFEINLIINRGLLNQLGIFKDEYLSEIEKKELQYALILITLITINDGFAYNIEKFEPFFYQDILAVIDPDREVEIVFKKDREKPIISFDDCKKYIQVILKKQLQNEKIQDPAIKIALTAFLKATEYRHVPLRGSLLSFLITNMTKKRFEYLLESASKGKAHYKRDEEPFFGYQVLLMVPVSLWLVDAADDDENDLKGCLALSKKLNQNLQKLRGFFKDRKNGVEQLFIYVCEALDSSDYSLKVKIELLSGYLSDVKNLQDLKERLTYLNFILLVSEKTLITDDIKDINQYLKEQFILAFEDNDFFTFNMKDFEERYALTFGASRNVSAIAMYLSLFHETEDEEMKKAINLFIDSVLQNNFSELRYLDRGKEITPQNHLLNTKAPKIWRKWQEKDLGERLAPPNEKYTLVNSDLWEDLLLSGTEVADSCQRVDGNVELNCCLMGYLLNGYNRIIAVKNEDGTIIARSIIRLLWNSLEDKPVLFQEKVYPFTSSPELSNAIDAYALSQAQKLGCDLYTSVPRKGAVKNGAARYGKIQSFGGIAPYEYADSGQSMDGEGGVFKKGAFTVKNPLIVS